MEIQGHWWTRCGVGRTLDGSEIGRSERAIGDRKPLGPLTKIRGALLFFVFPLQCTSPRTKLQTDTEWRRFFEGVVKDETDTICRQRVRKAKAAASAKNTNCVSYTDLRKQHKFLETSVATMLGQSGHFTAVCSMHT
ncbi:hypothetical protein EXN66_Car002382 [Channa argus]|uniref:Uncharacterized protein n=1 Tax=Channa argus TaxID=215402 RepID=A0A6G1P8T0_CHAAH|nr:hypothetical protein EXN66_Car002382 [Channa argus]